MKFKNVIICDDVRTENSGKDIIIGVYAENIIVPKFPANILLCLWTQFFLNRNGDIPVSFRIQKNKTDLFFYKGMLQVNNYKKIGTMRFPGIPLQVNAEGVLVFQMKEEKKKWITIKEIPIKLQKA